MNRKCKNSPQKPWSSETHAINVRVVQHSQTNKIYKSHQQKEQERNISMGTEKEFGNTQHSFVIKIPPELGREGKYPEL